MARPENNPFVFSYPLWVCANEDNPGELVSGTSPDGRRFVPLFTDEDLAQRFLNKRPAQGFRPAAIPDAARFAATLRAFLAAGVSVLTFDSAGRVGPTRVAADAAKMLRWVESEIGRPEGSGSPGADEQ